MERLGPFGAARSALGSAAISITAGETAGHRWPGSYVLLIRLQRAFTVRFSSSEARLDAGWYAYAGSAKGPGGVGARIARHLSASKKPHWHVDGLTLAASRIEALAVRDRSECEIAARLSCTNAFAHVLPGFGSSDCRTCISHLLAWRD